ncbi:MAG: peptidylprolyl isomerase [Fidelibacterota bacterium]|nr:MAG: peptidylprolyl isomerase [Candidatus Neomarinimicrobiota bacterium]
METSAGTIKLRLFTDVAPGHSNNFKRLANFGYYDSTTFHRVVPDFVIQGGDILSRDAKRANDGTGSPGYTIPAEFNPRPHRKGTLAMARSRDPNSAGSQFYIALSRLPQLDNQYSVFGEVIGGLAVVDSIATAATDSRDNPVQPQRIFRVRVGPSITP